MSAIDCVYQEYKETCKIEKAFVYKIFEPKNFKMCAQCISTKININHEKRKLLDICSKHGINYTSCPWDINVDVFKVIIIRTLLDYQYFYTFRKRKVVLFLAKKYNYNDGKCFQENF